MKIVSGINSTFVAIVNLKKMPYMKALTLFIGVILVTGSCITNTQNTSVFIDNSFLESINATLKQANANAEFNELIEVKNLCSGYSNDYIIQFADTKNVKRVVAIHRITDSKKNKIADFVVYSAKTGTGMEIKYLNNNAVTVSSTLQNDELIYFIHSAAPINNNLNVLANQSYELTFNKVNAVKINQIVYFSLLTSDIIQVSYLDTENNKSGFTMLYPKVSASNSMQVEPQIIDCLCEGSETEIISPETGSIKCPDTYKGEMIVLNVNDYSTR